MTRLGSTAPLVAALLALPGLAAGNADLPTENPRQVAQLAPMPGQPGPSYGSHSSYGAPSYGPPRTTMRPRHEGSFAIGVPIWFTPDDGAVNSGVSFEGRYGLVLGPLVPELAVGWQLNYIDRSLTDGYTVTLDAFWISLGLKLQLENRSRVTPFVAGAFDLNFWHLTGDDRLVCGYYYCSSVANYEVGIGFSGRAGLALNIRPGFAIDLGARVAMTLATGVFEQEEAWVTPYLAFKVIQ